MSAATTIPPLDPHLELVRRIVLRFIGIGAATDRAMAAEGLGKWTSNATVAVLTRLAADGPTRPRALLEPTRLTRGGLSNLLERLERAGLVERSYGDVPGDRRGALVTITHLGAEMATAVVRNYSIAVQSQREALADVTFMLDELVGHDRSGAAVAPPTTMGQLEQLSRLGARLVEAAASLDHDDPTPGRTATVLCSAAGPEPARPKDLILLTTLSSGGVSQLLERLETADLVRRRSGVPPDRRSVVVELTDSGSRWLERFLTMASSHLRDLPPVVTVADNPVA